VVRRGSAKPLFGGSNPPVASNKPWGRICKAAGVVGVRPHDLRHSYVSVGTAGGESLALVGAIVGHSTMGMTERYAHLSDDPVRATADRISAVIAAAMGGTDPAQVLTINRRPR
jgi:integrase